ncbi:MAG: Gfo/Idh/MocA family protein [Planctomycetota bacterium]
MTHPPLRAAMSACGGISGLTLAAARASPDFDVVAIQDVDPAVLRRVGERYGIARRYEHFEDLLTDDVDFVVVNGPNHVHLPQVLAAVAAGKHCLVQKPMARTPEEGRLMVDAAARVGVRLGVFMFERGMPLNHEVRRMIAKDWLGAPIFFQMVASHDLYRRNPLPKGDWRRDSDRVGGGVFAQLAIHHVNLVRFFMNARPIAVEAFGSRSRFTGVEHETTLATVEYENGVFAQFASSYVTDVHGYTVFGSRGYLQVTPRHVLLSSLDHYAGRLLSYRHREREVAVLHHSFADAEAAWVPELEIHGAFARWIRDGGSFVSPGWDALPDLEVAAAVRRAIKEGTCVLLD